MVIRGALSVSLTAIVAMSLAGCSLFGMVEPSGDISALEKLPGVAAVEAESSNASLETQAVLNLYVTTTDDATREQIAPIVDTWWNSASRFDGTISLHIERPDHPGTFTLSTEKSTQTAAAAATEWFDLSETLDASTWVTSVVETRISADAGGPASVIAVLPALATVPTTERVVISSDDTTFTANDLPVDAAALTAFEALQRPFDNAVAMGGMTISVTSSTGPPLVEVDLSPDSLYSTPANETTGLFRADPMYAIAEQVLDAVPASSGATVSLSVFGNDSFAVLRAGDCTFDGELAPELWTYWAAC